MASAGRSKFFADSSSEESDTETSRSSDLSDDEKPVKTTAKAAPVSRFMAVESESESEDENRVVRSAKDKRWDALLSIIGSIRNHLRISDWVALQEGMLPD